MLPQLPYFPRPKLLAGALTVFATGLKQGITLFAPRRQGKTWFVTHELIPAAQEAGWCVCYLDLWTRRDAPELALVEGLEAFVAAHRRKGALSLKKVTGKIKPPGAELGLELHPAGTAVDTTALENRLAAAVDALVALRPTTLLVIDEFQALAEGRSLGFVSAFRAVLQRHQERLRIFYTGSSREALNNMFRRQRAPLFESAFPLQLPDLGLDFVRDRAAFLAERSPKRVSAKALNTVFDRLGRSPAFLNAVILQLIVAGDGDTEAAFQAWAAAKREEYVARLGALRPIDRAILVLLATPKHPSVFSARAIETITAAAPEDGVTKAKVQSAIRRLTSADLVAPTGEVGGYEIDDRALLVLLREQHGLSATTGEDPQP